jgi:hypothetical protein
MLVRNEIDLAFDLAISEVCGIELEPDEKDGAFLEISPGDERSGSAVQNSSPSELRADGKQFGC